jgi:hypothetical protein
MPETNAQPATDWERVEGHCRARILSLRELAASECVSHVAISKCAKKEGWIAPRHFQLSCSDFRLLGHL